MRWKLSARLRGACAVLSSVLLAGCQAPAGSGGAPPAGGVVGGRATAMVAAVLTACLASFIRIF